MISTFKILKNISSFLWILFGIETMSWYLMPAVHPQLAYWIIANWMLLVLMILEEIYYMIEEKMQGAKT